MYGLPKIHKPDVPLRPIVSFYSSPTYQLCKHLCRLLSPLVVNIPTHINNSSTFSNFVKTQRLGEEILVSFDVVSLFTKVPIELAIQVAKERLQEENTLEDRTAYPSMTSYSFSSSASKLPIFRSVVSIINRSLEQLWVPQSL